MIEPLAKQFDSEESEQEDNDNVGGECGVTCTVHGYSNPQTMKVKGLLKRQPVTVLIDTGCTNNFLDEGIAQRLMIHVENREPFEVKIVDGGTLTCKISPPMSS
jgi:hypothetical protein